MHLAQEAQPRWMSALTHWVPCLLAVSLLLLLRPIAVEAAAEQGVDAESPLLIFGQTAPLSGPRGQFGRDLRRGVLAGLQQSGLRASLVSYDDVDDSGRARNNTLRLIEEDGVMAMVGVVGKESAREVVDVAVNRGVPILGAVSGASFLRTPFREEVLNFRASAIDEVAAAVHFLTQSLMLTRISLVYSEEEQAMQNAVVRLLGSQQLALVSSVETTDASILDEIVSRLLMYSAQPEAVLICGERPPSLVAKLRMRSTAVIMFVSALGLDSLAAEIFEQQAHHQVYFTVPLASSPFAVGLVEEYSEALAAFDGDSNGTLAVWEGYLTGRLLAAAAWQARSSQDIWQFFYDEAVVRLSDLRLGPFGGRCQQIAMGCQCNQGERSIISAGIQADGSLYKISGSEFDFTSCGFRVPTLQPIRFGYVGPFSSSEADVALAVHGGIVAAFQEASAHGELGLSYTELIVRDDQNNSTLAEEHARDLIENYQVLAILAPIGAEVASAVCDVATSLDVPVVGPVSGARSLRVPFRRNIINIRATTMQEAFVLVQTFCLQDLCSLSFAMVAADDEHGDEALAGVIEALHEYGLDLEGVARFSTTAASRSSGYASVADALAAQTSKPEVILLAGSGQLLSVVAASLTAQFPSARMGVLLQAGAASSPAAYVEVPWPDDDVHIPHLTPWPYLPTRSELISRYVAAMDAAGIQHPEKLVSVEGYVLGRLVISVLRQLWPIKRTSFVDSFFNMQKFRISSDYSVGPFIDEDDKIIVDVDETGVIMSCGPCNQGRQELYASMINENYTEYLSSTTATWRGRCCGLVEYKCIPGFYRNDITQACQSCPMGHEVKRGSNGTSLCSPCPPGTVGQREGCQKCKAGGYSDVEGLNASRCPDCPKGWYSDGRGKTTCLECPPGYVQFEIGSSHCSACGTGEYQPDAGMSECLLCPAGNVSAEPGSTACRACSAGNYSDEIGQSACRYCPEGQFSNATGASVCMLCDLNHFASGQGSTACEVCPGDKQTEAVGTRSAESCMCPTGTYEPIWAEHACNDCPQGMTCEQGSKEAYLYLDYGRESSWLPKPEAKRKHMTLPAEPMRVFRCRDDQACPGGPAGTCGRNYDTESVACGECRDSAYVARGRCNVCQSLDWIPMCIAVALITACVLVATYVINRTSSLKSQKSISSVVIFGLVLRSYQLLNIYSILEMEWHEPMASMIKVVSLASFDLSFVRVKCIIENLSPAGRFGVMELAGPYSLCVMLVFVFVRWCLGANKHSPFLEVFNATGTFIHMFFLSGTLQALLPFMCYEHPGGHGHSMVSLPSLLCFNSNQHTQVVVMGSLSLLFVACPMYAAAVCVALLYPRYVKDVAFTGSRSKSISQLRVLYAKYRPEAYYYEVVLLTRSCALVLVPVLVSKKAFQILALVTIILLFTLVQLQINPWRQQWVNLLDGTVCCVFVIMLVTGVMALKLEVEDATVEFLSTSSFVVLIATLLAGMLGTAYSKFVPGRSFGYFICHHKRDAQAQARLLKMLLTTAGKGPVFIDSDDLEELDCLFDIVKRQVRRLVVYLTHETLTRPWCAGEIATAHEHKVYTCAIRTPTFQCLSDEELSNVDTYLDPDNVFCLESYFITYNSIEAAFRQLLDPDVTWTLRLRHWRSSKRFDHLTRELLLQQVVLQSDVKRLGSDCDDEKEPQVEPAPRKPDMIILSVEPRNDEACAAAGILLAKIHLMLDENVRRQICRFDDCKDSSVDEFHAITRAYAVVVVLSSGTLSCWQQLRTISRVMRVVSFPMEHNMGRPTDSNRTAPKVVPVYIPDFVFPRSEELMQISSQHWPDDFEEDKFQLLESFFRILAIYFATNAADNILVAQAQQVVSRLLRRKDDSGLLGKYLHRGGGGEVVTRVSTGGKSSCDAELPVTGEPSATLDCDPVVVTRKESGISDGCGMGLVQSWRSDTREVISGSGSTTLAMAEASSLNKVKAVEEEEFDDEVPLDRLKIHESARVYVCSDSECLSQCSEVAHERCPFSDGLPDGPISL